VIAWLNYIGTNKNGTAALGNGSNGLSLSNTQNDIIGGTVAGARNVISGNEGDGVAIFSPAGDSKVEGNFIGTSANGTADLGNASNGVRIFASDTTIGGATRAAGNVIAFSNEGDGVFIFSGVRNRILSNRIFQNGGLGIALGTDGVTNNDPDDPNTTQPDPDKDTGANNLQNFPVIDSVIQSTSAFNPTKISGTLNSTPNQEFTIQCFAAAPDPSDRFVVAADPSGHGEGVGFVAEDTTVTTGNDGNASFDCNNFPFPRELDGTVWSATATNEATGDTSEFSANFTVPVK
jgi:hypothetical protein